jgi:protein-tyrosine phosphatase
MGILGRLFSKQPRQAGGSFVNPVTTELHSHLIPGIDDGVKHIDESIHVLKELAALGYKKVITTPHIMGDFYRNSPENILPKLEELRAALKEHHVDIELHAAAEYMVDDALQEKIDSGSLLTFGNRHVLIELPFSEPSPNFKEILFSLQINGYKPVLAHPERYPYYAANPAKYEELVAAEVLLQVNIYSLVGYYSPQARKAAEYMIKHKLVSLVGSDTHGIRHIPVLKEALRSYNYEQVCRLPLLNNSL